MLALHDRHGHSQTQAKEFCWTVSVNDRFLLSRLVLTEHLHVPPPKKKEIIRDLKQFALQYRNVKICRAGRDKKFALA